VKRLKEAFEDGTIDGGPVLWGYLGDVRIVDIPPPREFKSDVHVRDGGTANLPRLHQLPAAPVTHVDPVASFITGIDGVAILWEFDMQMNLKDDATGSARIQEDGEAVKRGFGRSTPSHQAVWNRDRKTVVGVLDTTSICDTPVRTCKRCLVARANSSARCGLPEQRRCSTDENAYG